ncbi:hypothetical protein [Pontibacter fetidus]|uniref:Lipocalin-like domain-containing protein n=1 Tax=Pontibacter fetidus TaxID=2700082 RepID=A0A6B2H9H7_9BACT|nr:hypothetical protein [Pontibacter fetidus]NDK55944.1 hypothetical protein [Pontibacter fetidus]
MTALTSCSKDDDAAPSSQALLTAKEWQGNKYLIDGQDMSSFLDIDQMYWKFNTNGTYTMRADGDSENGTWELTSNNQKLLLDGEFTLDIVKLTNTALNVKYEDEDIESGESYTVEIRFIRD